MTKHLNLVLVAAASIFLVGCLHNPSQTPTNNTQTTGVPGAAEKQGETSITGTISQSGGVFYIAQPGGQPQEIESYSVELSNFVGQSVTVVGKYSGDTLFVGSVE